MSSSAPTRPATARTRAAQIAALGLLGSLSLTACQWTSPITTEKEYDAADGIRVNLGTLQFRDLLVVSDAKGGPGTVSALVYNGGTGPEQVTIGGQGDAAKPITVPAQSSVTISESVPRTLIPSVPVPPGAMMELAIGASAGNTTALVPVLAPHDYYATLKPTAGSTSTGGGSAPATSAATPSGSPTSTQTAPPQTAPATPTSTSTSAG